MISELPALGLSGDERASFRAGGFLCVRDLIDAEEVVRLRDLFVRLHESPIGITTGDRSDIIGDTNRVGTVTQITHLERYTAALLDSPARRRAFAIARDLLGPDVVLDCETMIVKLPNSPDATPWHQDEAFWPAGTTREAISFWIPLQDAGVDAGCMEFVPGSHAGGVNRHRPLPGVDDANGFEIVGFDSRFRVVCPLPAGSATVHHARTAHATGPNREGVARYAYILVFSGPTTTLSETRDFSWQGHRGRDKRRAASAVGLSGVINTALRKASVLVARLNAINDRRNWNAQRHRSIGNE